MGSERIVFTCKKDGVGSTISASEPRVNSFQLDDMISPSLRSIFESAHEHGKDRLRINLQLQAVSTELTHMYIAFRRFIKALQKKLWLCLD